MTPAGLAEDLLAIDPIAVLCGVFAAAVLAAALAFRRGGVDSTFVIRTFAAAATVGTLAKLVAWLLYALTAGGRPAAIPAPSGTDALLAVGGFLAIGLLTVEEAAKAWNDTGGEAPLVRRLLARALGAFPQGLARLRNPGRSPQAVEELPQRTVAESEAARAPADAQ